MWKPMSSPNCIFHFENLISLISYMADKQFWTRVTPIPLGGPMRRMALLLLTMLGSVAIDAQPKPNVVFIMTDDVGYGDLGSYGAPDIRTPVLDRLAKQGARFTDFYSNGTTCSPTRASLITGRYQQRYGME